MTVATGTTETHAAYTCGEHVGHRLRTGDQPGDLAYVADRRADYPGDRLMQRYFDGIAAGIQADAR